MDKTTGTGEFGKAHLLSEEGQRVTELVARSRGLPYSRDIAGFHFVAVTNGITGKQVHSWSGERKQDLFLTNHIGSLLSWLMSVP